MDEEFLEEYLKSPEEHLQKFIEENFKLREEIEQSRYAVGQHSLICDVLGVSPNPNEDGDTALEAVCSLKILAERGTK